MNPASWRITFPIAKAEEREDGLYLIGEASGPEVDSEGERMAPEAIERFAEQINAGMTPLVYRDAHKPDGVLRDLGVVTKAWITEEFHLGIEVRLDEDNPAAVYLHRSISKGKQYGMSVAGRVLDYVDEFVSEVGHKVRTYKNVVLTEISNTTRPAWTPSFGTVLSKAIQEAEESASDAENGESTLMGKTSEELLTDEQETLDAAEDTTKADDTAPESEDSTEKAEEQDDAAADEETEKSDDDADAEADAEAEETEKAGRSISNRNAQRLLGLYAEIGSALREMGVLTDEAPEKSVSEDDSAETLDKSEDEQPDETAALKTQVEELQRSLNEATARIEELEKAPKTTLPPVIERAEKPAEDVMDAIRDLDPMARLRLGLALAHGERIE